MRDASKEWLSSGDQAFCHGVKRATGRKVTCEELRPDVDWAYLRQSRSVIAPAAAEPV